MLYNFQAKTFIVIFFLLFNGKILGQPAKDRSLDPVIKSFLVPGWGQSELGYKKRSKIYGYLDVAGFWQEYENTIEYLFVYVTNNIVIQ